MSQSRDKKESIKMAKFDVLCNVTGSPLNEFTMTVEAESSVEAHKEAMRLLAIIIATPREDVKQIIERMERRMAESDLEASIIVVDKKDVDEPSIITCVNREGLPIPFTVRLGKKE